MNTIEGKDTPSWLSDRDRSLHFKGSFIILGVTGSGKTTLINYLTASSMQDVDGDDMASGALSITKQVMTKSGKYTLKDVEYDLTFTDTIGFDAADMNTGLMIENLMNEIIEQNIPRINGVIILVKMERHRYQINNQLSLVKRFFQKFKVTSDHVKYFITHSGQYSNEAKERYSKNLSELLETDIKNLIHVNVVKISELLTPFKEHYTSTTQLEINKVLEILKEMRSTFAPMTYIYDKINLNSMIKEDVKELKTNGISELNQFYDIIKQFTEVKSFKVVIKTALYLIVLVFLINMIIYWKYPNDIKSDHFIISVIKKLFNI